jgi:hypothetical protein
MADKKLTLTDRMVLKDEPGRADATIEFETESYNPVAWEIGLSRKAWEKLGKPDVVQITVTVLPED